MRVATLGAVVLSLATYTAAVALPFEDSYLELSRRHNQCPRTQSLHNSCDNEATCCRPGYGCNTSGQGSIGQVCVKRETPWCNDDSDCAKGQSCIDNIVMGKQTSFCGVTSPELAEKVQQFNVQAPKPKYTPPPKRRNNCSKTYKVKKGDTCLSIVDRIDGLTLSDFYMQNSQINKPSCDNLQIGEKYCVMPMSSCKKLYTVKKGDTCISVVKKYPGLTLSDFYRQNPSLNNPSCDNLIADYKYCVDAGMGGNPSSSMLGPSSMAMAPSSMAMAPSSMAAGSMTPGAKPTAMAMRRPRL